MIRRLALIFVAAAAMVSCAPATDMDAQQRSNVPRNVPRSLYSGNETGPIPVGSIPDVALHDNARNKDITLTIDYPTGKGPYPLIVWSHGYGGSNRAYIGLSSYWASNGYVVIRPAHSDQGALESQTATDWRNRVRDVTTVLDSLDKLEQQFPELQGKVEHEKIAVGGHSYGAFTAMLLGGLRTYPGPTSYADARVKAVVAMSPQGPTDRFGLTKDSWSELKVPTLFLTGTLDRGLEESETPEWRREAYTLAPAGDKWLVVIEGARHASFTGRLDDVIEAAAREAAQTSRDPLGRDTGTGITTRDGRRVTRAELAGMRQQEIFAMSRGIALSFFDTYVKNDPKAREALEKARERKGVTLETK